MQVVRQVVRVVGAEQRESVDVVQVRIARIAARIDDFGHDLADAPKRHAAVAYRIESLECRELAGRTPPHRSGTGFSARTEDGRYGDDGRVGLAFADRIEEAVQGGGEYAFAHRIRVDDVDPDLDADQVGVGIADGTGNELVQVALSRETQVLHRDVCASGRHRGPDVGGFFRLRALTDGTAVVNPLGTGVACRRKLCLVVDDECPQLDGSIVRQPQFTCLGSTGEVGEPDGVRFAPNELETSRLFGIQDDVVAEVRAG